MAPKGKKNAFVIKTKKKNDIDIHHDTKRYPTRQSVVRLQEEQLDNSNSRISTAMLSPFNPMNEMIPTDKEIANKSLALLNDTHVDQENELSDTIESEVNTDSSYESQSHHLQQTESSDSSASDQENKKPSIGDTTVPKSKIQYNKSHRHRIHPFPNDLKKKTDLKDSEQITLIDGNLLSPVKQSSLFMQIKKGDSDRLTTLIHSFCTSYTSEQHSFILTLVNIILEAAGFPCDSIPQQSVEGTDPQDIIDEAIASLDNQNILLTQKYPLKTGDKILQNFSEHYRLFWKCLSSEFDTDLLIHQLIFDLLIWILPLSNHRLRNLRHAGTLAGLSLCEGLLLQLNMILEDIRRYSLQLQTEKKAHPHSGITQNLQTRLNELKEQETLLNKLIDNIIIPIPNVRWRDTCSEIRYETFSSIDDTIRMAASEFLKEQLQLPHIVSILRETHFISSFLPRLLELPGDKHFIVCQNGIEILLALTHHDLLTDEQIEKITENLWFYPSLLTIEKDDMPLTMRKHYMNMYKIFSQFIDTTIFSTSIIRDDNTMSHDKDYWEKQMTLSQTTDALNLRSIIEFFVEFAEDYIMYLDVFVTIFWEHAPSVRRIDLLVDFLTVGESEQTIEPTNPPLAEKYRFPSALLILSIFKHLELTIKMELSPRALKFKSTTLPIVECQFTLAIEAILKRLPTILRVCKANPQEFFLLSCVAYYAAIYSDRVSSYIDVSMASKTFSDAFINCSDIPSLDYLAAGASVTMMTGSSTVESDTTPFNLAITTVVKDVMTSYTALQLHTQKHPQLISTLSKTANDNHIRYMEDFELCLRKLLSLAKSSHHNFFWDNWDIITLLLTCCDGRLDNLSQKKKKMKTHKTSPYCVILSFHCLILAYFHLWSDVDELLEDEFHHFTSTSNESLVSTNIVSLDTKSTDLSLSPEIITTSSESKKRLRSSQINVSMKRPQKRHRQQLNIHFKNKSPISLSESIIQRLDQLYMFGKDIRQRAIHLLEQDTNPYIQYTACITCLETLKCRTSQLPEEYLKMNELNALSSPHVAHMKTLLEKRHILMNSLEFSKSDIYIFVNYFKSSLSDLEYVLEQKTSPILKMSNLPMTSITDVSFISQHKPHIPILGDIIDKRFIMNEEPSSTPLMSKENNKCHRFILWRILYLLRLFGSISSPMVYTSALGPLMLSTLSFRRADLDTIIQPLLEDILMLSENNTNNDNPPPSIFWSLMLQTVEMIGKDTQRKHRLKIIFDKISKKLPNQFIISQRTELFDFFSQACQLTLVSDNSKQQQVVDAAFIGTCIGQLIPKFTNLDAKRTFFTDFVKRFPVGSVVRKALERYTSRSLDGDLLLCTAP